MSVWSQEAYLKAMVFSAEAHGNQKIPGSDLPYLVHISLVSMEVVAALAVEEVYDGDLAVQCAILHDVLEDTSVNYDQVLNVFGEKVANGVQALTKNNILSKNDMMIDSLARIRLQSKEVWMVKLADRITNLQSPPKPWTTEKMRSYQQEAKLIHEFLEDGSKLLSDRLMQKNNHYSSYFQFHEEYQIHSHLEVCDGQSLHQYGFFQPPMVWSLFAGADMQQRR